jgi:cephalosporin hydroxylase
VARSDPDAPEDDEPSGQRPSSRPGDETERQIIDAFHQLYYQCADRTWMATRWLGVPILKCPLDLWIYQEILSELTPDVIVETGSYRGGSALFLASICELLGHGRIYSIDVHAEAERPRHPRIEYLTGSSTSPELLAELRRRIAPDEHVLVILDSDHAQSHVLTEIEAYRHLVTPGSYLIVEDTNVNGHPVFADHGAGPWEAIEEFQRRNLDLVADREREKFFLSFNPGGFLRRNDPAQAATAASAATADAALPAGSEPTRGEPARLRAETAILHRTLAALARELADARHDAGELRAHAHALTSQLALKEDELRQLHALAVDKGEEAASYVASLQAHVEARNLETTALQASLDDKHDELRRLHELAIAKEGEIARHVGSLQGRLEASNLEITALRASLDGKHDELRRLHELAIAKEAEVARYVGSLRWHLEASAAEVLALRSRLSAREAELSAILAGPATPERDGDVPPRAFAGQLGTEGATPSSEAGRWRRLARAYRWLRRRLLRR